MVVGWVVRLIRPRRIRRRALYRRRRRVEQFVEDEVARRNLRNIRAALAVDVTHRLRGARSPRRATSRV